MARRIAELFPRVKLIAMLRDPVERAISSYWQTVVLGDEERSIDDALEAELSPAALAAARARPEDGHQHVASGEYGRLLGAYLQCFEREQLFVGSTAVLGREPMTLLRDLWRFLGVSDSHVPPNLGRRYQVRGTGTRRSRAFRSLPRVVERTPALHRAWMALPDSARVHVRARLRVATHRRTQREPARDVRLDQRPDPAVVERLRRHYAPDIARLERLVGPVHGVTDAAWAR
jgi:hypothetical protein